MRLFPLALLLVACGGADEDRVDDILALDGDAAVGVGVYDKQCSGCHGDDGEGGVGPALDGSVDAYSPEQMVTLILDGQGDMPPHDYMEDQDIADLLAHLEATW